MEGFSRFALALVIVIMALASLSQAQNTPQDFLDPHNSARKQVGVGPMMWNSTVAAYAQDHANESIGDCKHVHSGRQYGENLFKGSGKESTAAEAVATWVYEKEYYDYDSNKCMSGKMCGAYTQVVWRNSTMLGCARVTCNSGDIFIVCSYSPMGNIPGERPY